MTNPCHYTLREATAYVLCLSDLNRGSKSILLQEGSEYLISRVWWKPGQRHLFCLVSTSTQWCLHLQSIKTLWLAWVWWNYERTFILRELWQKLGFYWSQYSFRLVILIAFPSTSACSELALEVGVTVHEVGYKHHMASYFSGRYSDTCSQAWYKNKIKMYWSISKSSYPKRHSSHVLLDLLHQWSWISRYFTIVYYNSPEQLKWVQVLQCLVLYVVSTLAILETFR